MKKDVEVEDKTLWAMYLEHVTSNIIKSPHDKKLDTKRCHVTLIAIFSYFVLLIHLQKIMAHKRDLWRTTCYMSSKVFSH